MAFLLWLAALIGIIVANGTLHTVALVAFIVLSAPVALGVLALVGVGISAKRSFDRF